MIIIRNWMVAVILLLVLALTSPRQQAHIDKLQNNQNRIVETASMSTPDYRNHTEFEFRDFRIVTFTRLNGSTVTFGILGMVFVLDDEIE